jgi:hypothetical protein
MPLMTGAGIEISRTPYEEPYHLRLRITASNGRLCGELEYYCSADDLLTLGAEMRAYSGNREREIAYQLGSEKPEERFAFSLSLRVRAIDSRGDCRVIVRLNNNESSPDTEVTEFSIPAEVADVNRLGELLAGFGELRHRLLIWRVTSGELMEDDQQAT